MTFRLSIFDYVDPVVSVYSLSGPKVTCKTLYTTTISGFFVPELASKLFDDSFSFALSNEAGFVGIIGRGFHHSPVSWDQFENSYLNGGENDYTIIRKEDGSSVAFQILKVLS